MNCSGEKVFLMTDSPGYSSLNRFSAEYPLLIFVQFLKKSKKNTTKVAKKSLKFGCQTSDNWFFFSENVDSKFEIFNQIPKTCFMSALKKKLDSDC